MSYDYRRDQFYEKVEKDGLEPAFDQISEIASDKLGVSLEDIVNEAATEHPLCRIRYQSPENGTESYIFEIRKSEEEKWGFMCSFELKDNMIHYMALTQVRELMKLGYTIYFE